MKIELFTFQKRATAELREKASQAVMQYRTTLTPQVVSLQAPTGSGKTVMMTAFIERVLMGDAQRDAQPNAVFVWLSDSPALNEQSRQKILAQSDVIGENEAVQIDDASFDRETFDDGRVYFLNTGKISKAGNLGKKSDDRTWTIWETLRNTAREKSDRLYFIIDEAHRGMQGNEGGRQTAIMQRFLRGWPAMELAPMPVVIGMSATPERFNKLVENLSSTFLGVRVATEEVRRSGLLKDRIVVTYPEDSDKQDPIAVLAAATEEWVSKCAHWLRYSNAQERSHVDPVFVVQVKPGSDGKKISDTDLDAALAKIAEVAKLAFAEGEVVHTFGSTGEIMVNGLRVPRVKPEEIAADHRIKVVFFKENLSTGWDCPRAETMMSFRRAEDYTWIAQLLGRMIRTPLQCHIKNDDTLNEVRLFLPYFDEGTVSRVIDELKASECSDLPTVVVGEYIGANDYKPWHANTTIRRFRDDPNQPDLFDAPVAAPIPSAETADVHPQSQTTACSGHLMAVPQQTAGASFPLAAGEATAAPSGAAACVVQPTLPITIDRAEIIRQCNRMGLVRYEVKTGRQRIDNYLDALMRIASLLTREAICRTAQQEVFAAITDMMRASVTALRGSGRFAAEERLIREVALKSRVFDAFGASLHESVQREFAFVSDDDIGRQLREAERKLGAAGLCNRYGRRFAEDDETYKIECIVLSRDEAFQKRLHDYAKRKFRELDDANRRYLVMQSEEIQSEYDAIVASSDVVTTHNFILPQDVPPYNAKDGKVYSDHLYADDEGRARIGFDSRWEGALVEAEERRNDFACWLRNPARMGWALSLAYVQGNEHHAFYPDILVFRRDDHAANVHGYLVDILEPHADCYSDNLPKAQSLARYAQTNPCLGRVQLIRQEPDLGGGRIFRRLDFCHGEVREAVVAARNDEDLNAIFARYGTRDC